MDELKDILDKIKAYEKRETALKLDIEELKRLNAVLNIAEEKSAVLNSIIESSDDAIISKNLNGIITSWNSSAARIFGYQAVEIIGQSIMKLIPPHLHEEEPKIFAQLNKGIRIDHFETQRLRKDGSLVDVSLTISPIKDGAGRVVGVSKIARDLTIHRKAEVDGRRLMAIIESSDDAIISKDFNSIVTSWNASAERIFGFSAKEMIGQSILKIIPEERHDEEPHILAQLRQGIRVDHFETERLRKDGSLISVSLTISPIKDGAGRVVGVSKIARDITDKKLIEKKKDEFINFVSHELKTPLTSLKSYIQIAMHKKSDPDFVTNILARAASQTKKMEHMIGDFLNTSRFESGHFQLKRCVFNLTALIEDCIADARISDERHEISHSNSAAVFVYGDYEKIQMVLTNLIGNAQKYSPHGGKICIRSNHTANQVLVEIEDQGIGISESDQKNIFQKFHRIENEQTKMISGFGIGLYLSSTILKLHQSVLKLKSEPGKGSTFSFALEFAEA